MKRWIVARLEDIPPSAEIPVPGLELTPEEEQAALRERAPVAVATWERMRQRHGDAFANRKTHAVRRFLGVESFGVNACEANEGEALIPEHDEVPYGQEELFLVVKGRARFVCDGEEADVAPGEIVYAKPEVTRFAVALESPTLLLIVGGVPGEAYRPPVWARDWTAPPE
jgi:mannose-6-phosphate isomerase-like protein (cupin superfamily)